MRDPRPGEGWTDWIAHDDSGWPADLDPRELVIADISGDVISPMMAREIDWRCPGDPVIRYKRRVQRKSTETGMSILRDILKGKDVTAPVVEVA